MVTVKNNYSDEEWSNRINLAACYHLADYFLSFLVVLQGFSCIYLFAYLSCAAIPNYPETRKESQIDIF